MSRFSRTYQTVRVEPSRPWERPTRRDVVRRERKPIRQGSTTVGELVLSKVLIYVPLVLMTALSGSYLMPDRTLAWRIAFSLTMAGFAGIIAATVGWVFYYLRQDIQIERARDQEPVREPVRPRVPESHFIQADPNRWRRLPTEPEPGALRRFADALVNSRNSGENRVTFSQRGANQFGYSRESFNELAQFLVEHDLASRVGGDGRQGTGLNAGGWNLFHALARGTPLAHHLERHNT